MKILLVDDDISKQNLIREKLREIEFGLEIFTAATVKDAKRELKISRFDLLIIDLVIPLSDLAPRPSRTGGLALLEWLESEENKPSYIIGISGFTDVAEEQTAEFADRSWCVLRYDLKNTAWFDQLRALVLHIRATKNHAEPRDFQLDVLVVTALRNPELEAVLALNWNFGQIRLPVEGRQFVRLGRKSMKEDRQLSIAAGSTSKMGMVWTSLFVSSALRQFRPRFVAMTGICMGHPIETNIGDIVVGVHSWNWQAGRLSAGKDGAAIFEIQPEPVVASKFLANLWDDMAANTTISEKIHRDYYGDKPEKPPKIKVAPMVSGSVVVAHEAVHRDIFEQDRKIRAVDMETFGVYAACEAIEDLQPLFISVKSVSDLGLPDKEDKYQKYCAYASAKALDLFLDEYWETISKKFQ
ncbi:nucleoside phosphorylase [Acidovorax sp. 62]|uniref:phosphorylase family protein n=1 Tax=Acidovorax sp. 62 TaxID=2035203 RepID=UPI000C38CD85|nr:response regulator [Acidovorax sp. 62]PIF90562.1 nucleoside phosphorylase [Acidovorax sp. 62]